MMNRRCALKFWMALPVASLPAQAKEQPHRSREPWDARAIWYVPRSRYAQAVEQAKKFPTKTWVVKHGHNRTGARYDVMLVTQPKTLEDWMVFSHPRFGRPRFDRFENIFDHPRPLNVTFDEYIGYERCCLAPGGFFQEVYIG